MLGPTHGTLCAGRERVQTTIAIARKLSAPADQAWVAVAAVGRLDVWFPSISGCEVEGEGLGAVRHLTLEGGLGTMRDIVRSIEPEERRLTYERVESPFPVTSYVGTVEVFTSFDGAAVVVWTVDFESEPENSDVVAELLTGAIGDGVAGMDADLTGST